MKVKVEGPIVKEPNDKICSLLNAGRPGSSEVPRTPLTRWHLSSTPANGIFLIKKTKKQK